MSCVHCNDTGSLSKDTSGYLDCGHCNVATERAELEAWAARQGLDCYAVTALWLIYQHGKQAGANEVPRTGA
jgi:hypothetical protein